MQCLLVLGLCILIIQQSVAPPVAKEVEEKEEDKPETDDYGGAIEYHKYLKEVAQILESDPEFREKLDNFDEKDIKNGKIAEELVYLNHHVRTKLDEVKRREIERLRHLATKEFEIENDLDIDHLKIHEHVDHDNPHTFEIDDLKKLIATTTKKLAEADERRRREFKEYEMKKKFEQEEKMKGNTELDEQSRKKYEEELHNMEEKHKKHDPLHHPGSQQQLEEVWEKEDHMDTQEFNPKTFFYLHDLDGNGVWDPVEVKALFRKELDKLYAEGNPEDDLLERAEEMERMREHVYQETDLNKDGLISLNEFIEQTKKPSFKADDGWKSLDQEQIYSQQEYEEFHRRRQEQMAAHGMAPNNTNHSELPQQFPPQHGQAPIQGYPQGFAANQQVPYHGQPMQQQYQQQPQHFQNQIPQQQMQGQYQQYQQVPQYQPQQTPQQVQQQQIPQLNQATQQVVQQQPPQQVQNQIPPQQQIPQLNQATQQQPTQQVQSQVPPQQQIPQLNQAMQQQPPVPQQQYQGQAAQPQYQGQVPQQQQQFQGQIPQQQQFQGQIPQKQQQYQGQVPQQQQQYQGQVPQQQFQAQVPLQQQGQVTQQQIPVKA